jgi:hypothetical protein
MQHLVYPGYYTKSHTPLQRGFDSYYGYLNGVIDYWTKKYGNHLDLQSGNSVVKNVSETNSSLHNGYLLTSKAISIIATHATKFVTVLHSLKIFS